MDKDLYSPPKSNLTDLNKKTGLNLPASVILGCFTSLIALLLVTFAILMIIAPDIFSMDDEIIDLTIRVRLANHPLHKLFIFLILVSFVFTGPWITTKLSGKNWKKIGFSYAMVCFILILIVGYLRDSTIYINLILLSYLMVIFLFAFLGAYFGKWKNVN